MVIEQDFLLSRGFEITNVISLKTCAKNNLAPVIETTTYFLCYEKNQVEARNKDVTSLPPDILQTISLDIYLTCTTDC